MTETINDPNFPHSESIAVTLAHRTEYMAYRRYDVGYVIMLEACHHFYYKKNVTVLFTKIVDPF